MKKLLLLSLLALLSTPACAVEDATPKQVIGPFGTLNNADDPMVIPPTMAADLLNVEVTKAGQSVRKRKGLGLAYTLPVATSAVHGIYSFYDANGNDVSLFFNDHYLTASVGGGALTTLFSTNTYNATWQCTDSLGSAYCASSARTPVIKTNGVTYTEMVGVDSGTMVTATSQRLVNAGLSDAPSRIDFSGANDFTNWSLGGLPTSPYSETINAPGSRITHITAACNGLMWFKDASFGIILNPDDALNAQNIILAPEIGTLDNSSIQYPGGIQFRSQDGHIYNFDCAGIEKLTRDITPTIQGSGSRRSNSWTQTTQADFQTGASSPTPTLSTTISIGDVVPSSFTKTETSSASGWGSGTSSNLAVGTSSITLKTNNSGTATNPDFESAFAGNWTNDGTPTIARQASAVVYPCGTLNAQNGSAWANANDNQAGYSGSFDAVDLIGNVVATKSIPFSDDCTWRQLTLTAGSGIGKRVKFRISDTCTACAGNHLTTSDSYILGGDVTFYYATPHANATTLDLNVDNVQNGSSTITTGSFASQSLYTGTPYSFVSASATWTTNGLTPSFVLQKSANGSTGWSDVSTSTGVNVQTNLPYLRYLSTFTVVSEGNALGALQGVNILTRSSGTYFSAVKNAPNLTSWDTFSPVYQNNGGAHNFFIRSSTSPFYVLNSSPPWTTQSVGATVSASSGTYFQVIDSFTITSATDTAPALNSFTVNWFEGAASDKAYGIYFGKDNALWWAVPVGSGQSANNRIMRWDLLNSGWVLYDIPANGFLIRNQSLYIGSSAAGKIYKFGDTDSDDGTAINSYWKSKDFVGTDPTVDKEFTTLSVIAKSVLNSTMSVTYTLDASSATAYSLYLYNSASSILRNNRYLPAGQVGNSFNVQFGNNAADQYWELFGAVFGFKPKSWIVGN